MKKYQNMKLKYNNQNSQNESIQISLCFSSDEHHTDSKQPKRFTDIKLIWFFGSKSVFLTLFMNSATKEWIILRLMH